FERDQIYRGAILIVAGALFHGSVILMLPICLLSYARTTVQRLLLLVISALLYFYVFRETFTIYAHRYSSERIQSAGLAYRLAMNGLAAVLFLIFRRRLGFDEHDSKLWRNISLCTLALIPLAVVIPSSTAIDRFLLYLFPLQFVVFSRLPSILVAHQRLSFPRMAVVGYAALVQITFLNFGTFSTFYLPYRTIFNT
ncbi:MAG: EpsG family protein, partial [Sphingomonas sp.]